MSDYPPMATLNEMPLHPNKHLGPDDWWACRYPERPTDMDYTRYDYRCSPCLVAAQAEITMFGDRETIWKHKEDSLDQVVSLQWLVDRAKFWMVQ